MSIIKGGASGVSSVSSVNIGKNQLSYDAWGRAKAVKDKSILHGMFTFNVPETTWKETFNGTEQSFINAASVNGKLILTAGGVLSDETRLDTYRNPRYQPNRGYLYSNSLFLPRPTDDGERRFGVFTEESGAFFNLKADGLYATIRTTTLASGTVDTEYLIDTADFDLSKGNIFDIQFQWRGAGDYKFFINLIEVKTIKFLGTLTELSMFNPACPIAFECENLGDDVEIQCGCVDVTTEGGDLSGKTYGSIQVENNTGQVSVSGYNQPVIAVRSKLTVNSKRNTRDTLSLLASAYSDQKSIMRIWSTRDFTAISEGTQSWADFGDGHLEYIIVDPAAGTPMTFDTAKASPPIFGSRIGQDETYSTSALFEGRTDIYQTPGDMYVFTVHRENGGVANVGVTYEFAEEI